MESAFHGAAVITLDAKGRVAIPTRHRSGLLRAKVEQFPSFDPKASWWKRLLLGFEEHVSPDGSGRILLPPALRQHAKLERDAMMVGQGHYFELWDSGVWSAKLEQALSTAGAPPAGMEGFSL